MHPNFDRPAPQPRKRPGWIWPVAIIGVILFICCGGFGLLSVFASATDSPDTAVVGTDTSAAPTSPGEAQPSSQPKDGKPRADGWRLDNINFANDYEIPSATARVTNESASSDTAIFEITLLKGEQPVATFTGSANGIQKGKTTTVKFVGDNIGGWTPGEKYTLQFEKSL